MRPPAHRTPVFADQTTDTDPIPFILMRLHLLGAEGICVNAACHNAFAVPHIAIHNGPRACPWFDYEDGGRP